MATAPGDFWRLLRGSGATLEATIAGVSMLPTLADAARVRIRPDELDAYRLGDIVVCVLRDELYAHRIVHRLGRGARAVVTTLGDNRELCDPPTRVTDILGRVEARWAGEGWESPPPPPARSAAQRRRVRLQCLVLAACTRLHYGFSRRVAGTVLVLARRIERARRRP